MTRNIDGLNRLAGCRSGAGLRRGSERSRCGTASGRSHLDTDRAELPSCSLHVAEEAAGIARMQVEQNRRGGPPRRPLTLGRDLREVRPERRASRVCVCADHHAGSGLRSEPARQSPGYDCPGLACEAVSGVAAMDACSPGSRALLASALDAIIAIDASGRIVEWNPAAEHVFRYTRDQTIGASLSDLIIARKPGRTTRQHSGASWKRPIKHPRTPHRTRCCPDQTASDLRRVRRRRRICSWPPRLHRISARHHRAQARRSSTPRECATPPRPLFGSLRLTRTDATDA